MKEGRTLEQPKTDESVLRMSARELLVRLQEESAAGHLLNWRIAREQIHEEHERSTSESDRAMLLATFKAVMDEAERHVADESLEKFLGARETDYRLMIIRECLIGENVSTARLNDVTSREVGAGRMAEDHELRKLAVAGHAVLHLSDADLENKLESHVDPKPSSRWRKLFRRS